MKYRYLKNIVTLQLDAAKCNGCGICTEVCPQQVFTVSEKQSTIQDRDACLECGACAKNCPCEAISVRAGVGCAYAVLMSKLNKKGACCSSSCGCEIS